MTDYQGLTDDQIFALATQPEDLSDEARGALEAELRRRNISTDDIGAYEAEVAEINRSEELNIGSPRAFRGIGRKFFGRSNYNLDALSGLEEFDTTLWFVFLFLPVIPLGTYRIRHKRRENWWHQFFSGPEFIVVDKLARNWEQIFTTWIKTVLVLFALRFTLPWLLELTRQ